MKEISPETERIKALHALQVLDTPAEPAFDSLIGFVSQLFDVPHAAIHLVDEERQWPKAFVGHYSECARGDSFCQFTIQQAGVLCVADARRDPAFVDYMDRHEPPVVFYAGAPLCTRGGQRVGTLCISDSKPRETLGAADRKRLEHLAQLAVDLLELRVEQFRTREALDQALELDPVTGLRNRFSLLRGLQHALAGQTEPDMTLLKVRLDRMDMVKQASGEAGRNAVLRGAAERLLAIADEAELVAQGDGDAFILARTAAPTSSGDGHKDTNERSWADARADAVRAKMSEPFDVKGEALYLSASIGMACSRMVGDSVYAILDAADAAAREQQAAGGNACRWFEDTSSGGARQRFSLERRLRAAVEGNELAVAYQPIVDFAAGNTVAGAEALVRWPGQDPMVGSPAFFIPLAEEIGVIDQLGRAVFEQACRQLAVWHAAGHRLWTSVNLAPAQLDAPDLCHELERMASKAGIHPADIKLEVTESSLNRDHMAAQRVLGELSDAGFHLALDDFGTGFSSLARIIRLPFNVIKLDRGFVSDCPGGPGAAVVSSLSDLAASLGMDTVAEGIETAEQQACVRHEGVQYGQGYYYAAPLYPAGFMDWLEATK